jgi:hypothetical protein
LKCYENVMDSIAMRVLWRTTVVKVNSHALPNWAVTT